MISTASESAKTAAIVKDANMTRDRLDDWDRFAARVHNHIENYANVQYGNPQGDEHIDSISAQQCVEEIYRYTRRFGKNVRGPHENYRDLLKMAHYAQFAFDKLLVESRPTDTYC